MSDVGFIQYPGSISIPTRLLLAKTQYYPALVAMTKAANDAGLHHDDCFKMTQQVLDQIADTEPESIDRFDDYDGLGDSDTWPLVQWLARNHQVANIWREEQGDWGNTRLLDQLASDVQELGYRIVAQAVMDNWPVVDEEGNVK